MSTLSVAYTLTFFFLAVALAGLLDRLINRPAHAYHETADEAEWAEAYVTWRIDQIHGRGPYDQEADS